MMRRSIFCLALAPLLLFAESDEEALALRRIADFWEEGEHKIASMQMEEFISLYPENIHADAICAALGDLSLRQKNYTEALKRYSEVKSPEILERIFLNRLQCLYEMQDFPVLAQECEAKLKERADPRVTYYLAIALYYQVLSAPEPEAAMLAEKAKPLFETLFQSEFAKEVAEALAHLCFIVKDYPMAASIYLDLAGEQADEDKLFQAALIQTKYDKEKALDTFSRVMAQDKKRAQDAAYNRIALLFELGRYELLTSEEALTGVAIEQLPAARLFIGRSLMHLDRCDEAIEHLSAFVRSGEKGELLHSALLSLVDAAYKSGSREALERALAKLSEHYPQDPALESAYFARVQLLKKEGLLQEARAQLEGLLFKYDHVREKPEYLFELVYLDYKQERWESCREKAAAFLAKHPDSTLSSYVLRYRLMAVSEMGKENNQAKEELQALLEPFVASLQTQEEYKQWALLLAKTYYELGSFEKALSLVSLDSPNEKLLIAFCHRDFSHDLELFCSLVQEALLEGADLISKEVVEFALFNAKLELNRQEEAAEHLYMAVRMGAVVQPENLLWLSDVYYRRLMEEEGNFAIAERAAFLLEKVERSEAIACRLANAYTRLGRPEEALALVAGRPSDEAKLIYAGCLARKGVTSKALSIFDSIVSEAGNLRKPEAASACLQACKIKKSLPDTDLNQIAMQLKNLTVQKRLSAEPVYLEAALDYVELVSKGEPKKKIALLAKTKQDFEAKEDLLAKDYHEAKARAPEKEKMYQGYMQLIEALKLQAQAELYPENQEALKEKALHLTAEILQLQKSLPLLERTKEVDSALR